MLNINSTGCIDHKPWDCLFALICTRSQGFQQQQQQQRQASAGVALPCGRCYSTAHRHVHSNPWDMRAPRFRQELRPTRVGQPPDKPSPRTVSALACQRLLPSLWTACKHEGLVNHTLAATSESLPGTRRSQHWRTTKHVHMQQHVLDQMCHMLTRGPSKALVMSSSQVQCQEESPVPACHIQTAEMQLHGLMLQPTQPARCHRNLSACIAKPARGGRRTLGMQSAPMPPLTASVRGSVA